MSKPAYLHASDLFPPKLLAKVTQALDGKTLKITFAPSGKPPNKSEAVLPPELAEKCRRWVDDRDSGRTIYFGGKHSANRVGKPAYAFYLSKAGISIGAIQTALGITYPTAAKYGAKASRPVIDVSTLEPDVYTAYREAGEARAQELGKVRTKGKEEFYVLVGAALEMISKRSESWDAKIKKAQEAE